MVLCIEFTGEETVVWFGLGSAVVFPGLKVEEGKPAETRRGGGGKRSREEKKLEACGLMELGTGGVLFSMCASEWTIVPLWKQKESDVFAVLAQLFAL